MKTEGKEGKRTIDASLRILRRIRVFWEEVTRSRNDVVGKEETDSIRKR